MRDGIEQSIFEERAKSSISYAFFFEYPRCLRFPISSHID
jgi:hypothetical protein